MSAHQRPSPVINSEVKGNVFCEFDCQTMSQIRRYEPSHNYISDAQHVDIWNVISKRCYSSLQPLISPTQDFWLEGVIPQHTPMAADSSDNPDVRVVKLICGSTRWFMIPDTHLHAGRWLRFGDNQSISCRSKSKSEIDYPWNYGQASDSEASR